MSILQTVRYQVERGLAGVLQWQHFVVQNFTAQMAVIEVRTPKGNTYELVARSASEAPPLGQVVLRIVHSKDVKEDVLQGQNQDRTWLQVCEFLKAKETGDSSAHAAAKALAVSEPTPNENLAPDDIENPIPPVPFVYFIAQKGEFYRNGWAFVTTAHANGTLDLTVSARNHESYHLERVAQRSEQLRNHCFVDVIAQRLAFAEDVLRRMIEAEVEKRIPVGFNAPPPGVVAPPPIVAPFMQGAEWTDEQIAAMRRLDPGAIVWLAPNVPPNGEQLPPHLTGGPLGDKDPIGHIATGIPPMGEGAAAAILQRDSGVSPELRGVPPNSAGFGPNGDLLTPKPIVPVIDPVNGMAEDQKTQGASPQPGSEETGADPANPNVDLANLIGDTTGMSEDDIAALKELVSREQGEAALAELEKHLAGSSSAEANKS